jgi:hypothetical protein
MMAFFLYSVVALAANTAMLFLLHFSIQSGQWLDSLLDWQKKVFEWDKQGKAFLVKAIGGECDVCYSHVYSQLFFIPYMVIAVYVVGVDLAWWVWLIVWFGYVSIATGLSLFYMKYMRK